MLNLYTISTKHEISSKELSDSEKFSVIYHNLFDYPLSFSDLIKWQAGKKVLSPNPEVSIVGKDGFYFVEGKEGVVYKRLLRKRISTKKMAIAKKAAKILSFLPSVKMIAITGSLAMQNSTDDSDIDLMLITKAGCLWTTRLLVYMALRAFGFNTRRPDDLHQKDKLCLNMWLDESDLSWGKKDRNIYTAHEIAQIVPLVNKDKTYEKFLTLNKWVLDFWPNSVKIGKWKVEERKSKIGFLEKICYKTQCQYMKAKKTREVVAPTRALFHPQDWGKVVLGRLTS